MMPSAVVLDILNAEHPHILKIHCTLHVDLTPPK